MRGGVVEFAAGQEEEDKTPDPAPDVSAVKLAEDGKIDIVE